MTKNQKLVLFAVMLLALFFRFFRIAIMPGGLFPDEAANGLDIISMEQGDLRPFYERGNGREAMFFYLEWLGKAIFGLGHWQFHVVSATIGVLAVLACFLLARRLFNLRQDPSVQNAATNIALLAAFLMAVSTWHIVLSRTAFRATMIPLVTALTFYFLLRSFQSEKVRPKLGFAALAGASFAAGFYTYIAYRILVPILGMALLWPLLAAWSQKRLGEVWRRHAAAAAIFAVAFFIVIYPLARYFYQNPGSFVGRAGQVSVFNPKLYLVDGQEIAAPPPAAVVASAAWEVFLRQMQGFFFQGDLNWRQNVSGWPFLSVLYSPFFAVALSWSVVAALLYFFRPARFARFWLFFLLAIWFFGMMLPVVTTAEGIPHGLRGIGVIPPVFLLSAWALHGFFSYLMEKRDALAARFGGWWRSAGFWAWRSLAALFAVALVLQAYFAYFVYAYNDPANFYAFRSDLSVVSHYLRNFGRRENTYLVLDKFSLQTVDYLTMVDPKNPDNPANRPYRQVDPEDSWQLQAKPGDQVVFTQSSIFDIKKFKIHNPQAVLYLEYRNKFGQAAMAVYRVK